MTVCFVADLGPACIDLTNIRAGDANGVPVYLHHGDTPVDLTGQEVAAQARKAPNAADAIDATVVIDDPLSGRMVLYWDGEEIRTLLAGKNSWTGVWDLQVGVDTPVAGKFTAVMDVTRAA